ncbi:MAG: secretin N-terminal domain-containing protein [Planctomycetota bacterium]
MKISQAICARDRAALAPVYAFLTALLSLVVADDVWAQTLEDANVTKGTLTQPAAEDPTIPVKSMRAETRTPGSDESLREEGLWFAFRATPWRDVLDWIADESGLALHVNEIPTGSFTYSDPSSFTPEAAIDRINLFLLPEGFTLVRSGSLLSLINLGDPRSMQQLDAIAELVSLATLSERPSHEVVKCLFPLGDLTADEAVSELTGLQLMTEPAVFAKTNQIMITDTAAKLRSAQSILEAFTSDTLDNGTVVKGFTLQHVDAEDVLAVARPHLGLATGEMIGIDVSISADVFGKSIFVTGIEDKVTLIEGLIKEIDRPGATMSTTSADAVLQSHAVPGGNLDMVYDVLQTLLAGQSVRLSKDREADTIIALASASAQAHIAATVEQLQAQEPDFEVIPLQNVDPFYAIGLLQEMLDLPDALDDPDDVDPDAPKVDADPGSMRLYVRGRPKQIEQIRNMVEGLDQRVAGQSSADVRVVPMSSQSAQQTLEAAAKFWNEPSPVVLFRTSGAKGQLKTERVVSEPSRSTRLPRKNGDAEPAKTIEASKARESEPVARKPSSQLSPATLDEGARLPTVGNPFRPS